MLMNSSVESRMEVRLALEALRHASRVCRSVRATLDLPSSISEKADKSPVTVADLASQAIVSAVLERECPEVPVVGEEDAFLLERDPSLLERTLSALASVGFEASATELVRLLGLGGNAGSSERFWTLDPIDGTKGFLRKEQYAVALGLVEAGEVVVGALACPNLSTPGQQGVGSLFAALDGGGAWAGSLDDSTRLEPIETSLTRRPSEARLVESVEPGHSAHAHSAEIATQLGMTRSPVRLDSQAKYAVVARGEADLYLRLPTREDYEEKIWDHAAGALIVTEAGGRVTDIAGHNLDFSRGRTLKGNRGVVASNGRWHDEVLRSINSLSI